MKEMQAKVLSVIMTLVFVNFMFSNIVFVHTHRISDSRVVAHSHPYSPSAHQSHTDGELSLIAAFNAAAASVDAADVPPALNAPADFVALECPAGAEPADAACLPSLSRGPPQA